MTEVDQSGNGLHDLNPWIEIPALWFIGVVVAIFMMAVF